MNYIHPIEKKAMEFFCKAHGNKMYGHHHYSKHLQDVANVVQFYLDHASVSIEDRIDLKCAAWGHDAVEDAGLSYSDIKKEFNENVAEIIHCVTDDNNGRTRKEKKILSYPKIVKNPDAVIIKLADRIANSENSIAEKSSQMEMYQKEYKMFRWNLWRADHAVCLWERLDYLMKWRGW